jgi:hypothetical protein
MEPLHTALVALVNVPVYVVIARVFFGDLDGFFRALRYLLTPDLLSWFRGDWLEDRWQSFKVALWAILCVAWNVACLHLLREFV